MEPQDFLAIEILNLEAHNSKRPKSLIQRVSRILVGREEDLKKYFEPKVVHFGPFQHGEPRFNQAEKTKRRFAALFVKENETTGLSLLNKIKAEIKYLRSCYDPDDIQQYDDDQLSEMFVVDGSAVLLAIHYLVHGKFKELKTKAGRLVFAIVDLFMLENQLPYRVLQILIDSTKEPEVWKISITEFIAENVVTKTKSGHRIINKGREDGRDEEDYAHLLDRLWREHLTGPIEKSSKTSFIGWMLLMYGDSRRNPRTIRSIKELKESGIRVKPIDTNNLKNISFYCNFMGSLEMPCLLVDDSTAPKFMNLMALEMCPNFDKDVPITSYLSYFGSLINTAEDVKELRAAGVLHSYVGGDQEVAKLFKKMSRNLVPDQEIYIHVSDQILKYCNNPFTPALVRFYYTHWTMVGFLGGMAYLIFSSISAFLSIRKALKE